MLARRVPALLCLALAACASQKTPTRAPATRAAASPASRALGATIDAFYWADLEANPPRGARLGYHQYDGRLPDVSPAAIAQNERRLRQSKAELEAIDGARLNARERLERDVVLYAIRSSLFGLERRDAFRDPQSYVSPLALTSYVSRPYAPAADRARAVIAVARASLAYLLQADRNLEPNLPKPWLDTAITQVEGLTSFVEQDVAPALGALEPSQQQELAAALTRMATALRAFAEALRARLPNATQDYALGESTFLRMLEETQGVPTTLVDLERVAAEDLARNTAAIEAAARSLDPRRDPREVIAEVMRDKPSAAEVLVVAEAQAKLARAYVAEHGLVDIPSDHVAEVRATPPFMRYNLAFLDGSGPFEKAKLPSFYYISPPNPGWPEERQRSYVPDRWSLLSVTVHELWPGHFLHSLHIKRSGSRVLRTFRNYAMSEGWAHYAEEMMWEQGFTPDPRFRIGQLSMALLRDVRLICSIGLHARGMTVEQARARFLEQAFQDEGNAQQQAVRGTFDPMYGSYTLGKLMIMKLRRDYASARSAVGAAPSLREFHDRFLAYGAAPVSLIRRELLGPEAGPVL